MRRGRAGGSDAGEPDMTRAALLPVNASRIKRCSSCGASIIWFLTVNKKPMPVDASSVLAIDDHLDLKRHVVHWRTCPNAAKHRKPKG